MIGKSPFKLNSKQNQTKYQEKKHDYKIFQHCLARAGPTHKNCCGTHKIQILFSKITKSPLQTLTQIFNIIEINVQKYIILFKCALEFQHMATLARVGLIFRPNHVQGHDQSLPRPTTIYLSRPTTMYTRPTQKASHQTELCEVKQQEQLVKFNQNNLFSLD